MGSEAERESLYPPSGKHKKSITAPPNFPGTVTIIPGEEPYPEDTQVGGTVPSDDTVPTYTPTPPSTPPSTNPLPTPTPSIGQVFYPFKPQIEKGFASHPSDPNGCRIVDYRSGGSGRTCRWIASENEMKSRIGENGYKIEANLHIGDKANDRDQEISITSGGPGSDKGNCCGFTTRINIPTGELQIESEDWSEGGTTGATYCKGASCIDGGLKSISGGQPLYATHKAYIVTQQTGHEIPIGLGVVGFMPGLAMGFAKGQGRA